MTPAQVQLKLDAIALAIEAENEDVIPPLVLEVLGGLALNIARIAEDLAQPDAPPA